jgi:hypothetical protein
MSMVRWTSRSSTKLVGSLTSNGDSVSSHTVPRLLHLSGH